MFLKKKLNKRILITRQIEPSSQIANQHQHFDSLRTTFHRNSQTISKMLALQKKKKKKKTVKLKVKKKKKIFLSIYELYQLLMRCQAPPNLLYHMTHKSNARLEQRMVCKAMFYDLLVI